MRRWVFLSERLPKFAPFKGLRIDTSVRQSSGSLNGLISGEPMLNTHTHKKVKYGEFYHWKTGKNWYSYFFEWTIDWRGQLEAAGSDPKQAFNADTMWVKKNKWPFANGEKDVLFSPGIALKIFEHVLVIFRQTSRNWCGKHWRKLRKHLFSTWPNLETHNPSISYRWARQRLAL